MVYDILPRKNKEDAIRCLVESVNELNQKQANQADAFAGDYSVITEQTKKAGINWKELDEFQRTMDMQEMKLCINEKAAQDTQGSKEYVNSFILYGTDENGDFIEIYPSPEQRNAQRNPEYKFYFGNQYPPEPEWPRGENGNLEGIRIGLLPGAERNRIISEVEGQELNLNYPQLTWDIVQGIKSKLERAAARVYVLRDERIDRFTINHGRSTASYFKQQVESVDAFMIIGIHFNVGLPNNANKDTWVDGGATYELQHKNDVCAYVPGSYMQQHDELALERDRFLFIRDIVSRKMDESVELADCIIRSLCDKLSLPARPLMTNAMRMATEGVFYRNLAYPRISKCPVCYCSTAWIDNVDQFKKLVAGDYQDIIDGYYEGIVEYVAQKRFCI